MENNQDNVSINRTMSKPVKCVYYAIVLFGNVVVNKIPSRHIRKWFYQMLGAKIGKRSTICRRADILFPKGLNLNLLFPVLWINYMLKRCERKTLRGLIIYYAILSIINCGIILVNPEGIIARFGMSELLQWLLLHTFFW